MSNKPIDFNLTYPLPTWHLAPRYATSVTVEFDGAEGGAVWLQDAVNDEAIAIRGPDAMRELARMLNAFADGYTGPLKAERYQVLDASSCAGEMYFVEDVEQGHNYYSGKSLERAQAVAAALNKSKPNWHAAVRPASVWIYAAEGDSIAWASLSRAELAHLRFPNQLIEREILGVQHKLNKAIAYDAARA